MTRAMLLPGHRTRWTLFGMLFALMLAASAAWAEDDKSCSDTKDRKCTLMEELDYCIGNAVEAFNECKEDQPWYNDIACAGLYYIDFWACGLIMPIELAK